jgi:hypothetical protein
MVLQTRPHVTEAEFDRFVALPENADRSSRNAAPT